MGCINWAWKIQGLKANEKLLLVALADDAHKETGTCSLHTCTAVLARDCSMGRRNVQKLLTRLTEMDLIHWTEQNPGTDDGMRLYHVHATTIDPEEWRPPVALKRRSIMSTSAFQKILRASLVSPSDLPFYNTWLAPLRLLAIEKTRIVCRLPNHSFAAMLEQKRPWIAAVSKKEISPTIEKCKFVYTPEKGQKLAN